MRTTVAVGKISGRKVVAFARRCGWCGAFASDEDAARAARGVLITHSICRPCAAKWEAELEPEKDPETATPPRLEPKRR